MLLTNSFGCIVIVYIYMYIHYMKVTAILHFVPTELIKIPFKTIQL